MEIYYFFSHQTKMKRMMQEKQLLTLHTKLRTSLLFKLMASRGWSDCELQGQRVMINPAQIYSGPHNLLLT